MSGIRDIRIPLDVTERRFEALVLRAAMIEGWHRHHVRPAQTSKGWRSPVAGETGFPDLVLARNGAIIFAELKTEKTSPTAEQKQWLSQLSGIEPADDWSSRGEMPTSWSMGYRFHVGLWRPRHWNHIWPLLVKMGR